MWVLRYIPLEVETLGQNLSNASSCPPPARLQEAWAHAHPCGGQRCGPETWKMMTSSSWSGADTAVVAPTWRAPGNMYMCDDLRDNK